MNPEIVCCVCRGGLAGDYFCYLLIPLLTICTQIRPNKASKLIWIQTVWHSDGIPERFIFKANFEKTKQQTTEKHAKLPSMQEVNDQRYNGIPVYNCLVFLSFRSSIYTQHKCQWNFNICHSRLLDIWRTRAKCDIYLPRSGCDLELWRSQDCWQYVIHR